MNVKLKRSFYTGSDVVDIAKKLLGKVLISNIDGQYTSGIISETEAYNGIHDRASHAYGGRRTARTEIMYNEGGVAYVYLCYGIHSLFNVVTGLKDTPQAVLIRGIVPCDGTEFMEARRKRKVSSKGFSSGPGSASLAMGIHFSMTGVSLLSDLIWIEDRGIRIPEKEIEITPRIGVGYAGEDAALPWRFRWNPSLTFSVDSFCQPFPKGN